MPDFQLTADEATSLAEYLSTQRDSTLIPDAEVDWSTSPSAVEVRAGQVLVRQYQCLGCHRIGSEGAEIGPHLDRVGSRHLPDYIYALLLDPNRIIPGTPMKDSGLWDEEARSIVRFLQTLR